MFGLIGCSKSKLGEETPEREFPARELYDSWLFDGRVRAVQAHCDAWGVFSAEHGLLFPDDRVAYYDTFMGDLSRDERSGLAQSVVGDMPDCDRVMVLLGRTYADPLFDVLSEDVGVWDPLEGVQLFDQRSELERLAETDTPDGWSE